MAKKTPSRTKAAARSRPSRRVRRELWVRKRVVIDQHKLDVARQAFGVATDKEAIDQALDYVVFYSEVAKGMEAISLSGGLKDVFEGS